jgi:RecA/RadA recombinase
MADINRVLKALGQGLAIAENRAPLVVTPSRMNGFNTELMKIGGVAGGRIYELYAPASAGKSTLALILCADYQSQGKIAVYVDAEGTTQNVTGDNAVGWMENLGVVTSELIMPNFGSAEDLFSQIKTMIVSGANIIVIDTVAVLQPTDLIFREAETVKMNERMALPKALTSFFNGIVGGFAAYDSGGNIMPISADVLNNLRAHGVSVKDTTIHKLGYYDCAIIGVNHAKDMIGVMYGDPTYTPGGAALGFHSSVRIGITKPVKSKDKIKVGDYEVPLYRKSRVAAAKNKLAAPFGEMSLRIYQDGRVVEDVPFFVLAEQKGLVSTSARNVTLLVGEYKGTTMKKPDFEAWVSENPQFLEMVDEQYEVADESSTIKIPLKLGVSDVDDNPVGQSAKLGLSLKKS